MSTQYFVERKMIDAMTPEKMGEMAKDAITFPAISVKKIAELAPALHMATLSTSCYPSKNTRHERKRKLGLNHLICAHTNT
jgi:hypothetical protein